MKSNNNSSKNDRRGSYAKNAPRDSQGRIESKDQNQSQHSSGSGDRRGSNAQNEERDSQGRFTSSDRK